MKALSIRQPWVWAIFHKGKDIENRDWRHWNPGLKFRGTALIHASNTMTRDDISDFIDVWVRFYGTSQVFPDWSKLPRGALIGTVDVVDAVTEHKSKWFFGPYGLVLENPKLFREPIKLKGQLGFFDVPDELWRDAA